MRRRVHARRRPADVGWVALVEIENGSGLSATPLVRLEGAVGLVGGRGERTRLAGWADQQIAPVEAWRDPGEPLVRAEVCAPRLPDPVWFAEPGPDRWRELPGETPPPLTADWLRGRCSAPGRIAALVRCADFGPCFAPGVPRSDCSFEAWQFVDRDSSTCSIAPVEATLDYDDRVCVRSAPAPCEGRTEYDGAALDLLCTLERDGCSIRLYGGSAEPLADVVSATLFPIAEPYRSEGLQRFQDLSVSSIRTGYADDLLPLADGRVLIVRAENSALRGRCGLGGASEAVFVDQETLRIDGPVPAPSCLGGLAPDPTGTGALLGFFRDGDDWRLGRLADDLTVTASRAVALQSPAGELRIGDVTVARARVLAGGGRLAALFTRRSNASWLVTFDSRTLEVEEVYAETSGEVWDFAETSSGDLAFAQHGTRRFCLHSPGALAEPTCVASGCADRRIPVGEGTFVDTLAVGGELMTLSVSFHAGVWSCGDRPGQTSFAEQPVQPSRMHPWPADGRLVAVTGIHTTGVGVWNGILHLFDPAARTFLPFGLPLDATVVSRIRVDGRGRLWLLHPWEAVVSRLTLR